MLAEFEIRRIKREIENLEAIARGPIDAQATIDGLKAIRAIIRKSVAAGRKLVEAGAPDQVDFANEQAWGPIRARLDDQEGGCLRNVILGLQEDLGTVPAETADR